MYTLRNRITNKSVGRGYRSLENAVEDVAKMQQAIRKYAGDDFYLPIEIIDCAGRVILLGHPEFVMMMDAWLEHGEAV